MLKGEQAGTTLRASLIKLAKPTKASQKAMDELGVSLTDSKGKFVGMPALIGQFKNGLQGMTKEQKLAAVSQIVGTESASGFLALIDAGPNKLKKYSQELKNSNGASKEAADKMNNTLKGAIEQLGGAFESLSIKITQSNNGPLTALVKALGNIVEWFSKLPGPVLQMLTIFAGLTATIGPLLIMIGATANGITGIASAVTLLNGTKGGAAFFSIFKGGLGSILPNIGQLLTKIPILGGVFSVLGGALGAISAPVWIVIGAVAALGAAFVIAYKKSETFRNIVNAVINPVKNAVISLWNGIKSFATGIKNVFSGDTAGGFNIFKKILPKEAATQLTSTLLMIRGAFREFFTFIRTTSAVFGAAMRAFWKQHGSTIINTFNAIKAAVGVILGFLFNNIIKPILAGIGNHFRIIFGGLKAIVINVFTGIRMVVQGGLTAINGIINIFKGLFTGNFRLMWQGIKQVFSGALTAIGGMLRLTFGNLLIFIKTIGLMMLNSFKTIWTIIKNVVVGLAKALAFSVRATITALKTVLIAIFTALSVAARNIWNGLKNAVLSIVRALSAGIKALFNGLKAALTNIWNGIKAVSLRVWNAIKNGVIAIVRAYVNTVKAIFNALKNAISSIFNSIKSFFIRVWTTIKNSVVSIVRSLYNNLRNHFNNLKNIIRSIFTAIKSFLYSIWTSIKNKLSQIVQNIRDSVANKFNSLKRAVVDITSKLKGYIVNAWSTIKSKVVGLAQGLKDKVMGTFNKMKDGLSNIIGKIKGFINDMVDKVKGGLNNLIKGVNWVAGKIGMDPIPKLKLSTGTESTHTQNYVTNGKINRDTLATVGDKGRGNGPGGFRHEMIRYPNGKTAITPNRDTTAYLPKGSSVLNGQQTHSILKNNLQLSTGTLPKFSNGSGFNLLGNGKKPKKHQHGDDLAGDVIGSVKSTVGNVGKKAEAITGKVVKGGKAVVNKTLEAAGKGKDWLEKAVGDVLDYIENPKKLLEKVFEGFGINLESFGIKKAAELPYNMMSGMFKKLKEAAKKTITEWLEDSGGAGDGGYIDLSKGINFGFARTAAEAAAMGYPFPRAHHGLDINYKYDKVYSTLAGKATGSTGWNGGFGRNMWIRTKNGIEAIYGHLSKLAFSGTKQVKPGDYLGVSGGDPSRDGVNAGSSTGPHLHYEMRWNGVPKDPTDWLRKNNGGGKGGKGGGKKAPSAWRSTIIKAAKRMKVNPTNAQINGIIAQIQRESGGDAGITQSTAVRDINAITGNLARGLLQYVPSTFDAYKVKGHGNITSGYDQLLAFFNNSNWANDIQYGRSGWGPRGSRRFATGGLINSEGWYNLAEGGYPEWVIPTDPSRRSDAMKLLELAAQDIQSGRSNNKRPNNLRTPSANNSSDNTELLLQMIENQQAQINVLMQIARSNQAVADKDFKPSIDKYAHKQQVYSAIDDYNRQKERKSRF